ncbi:MAG: efflux transporter outer membrane subunit [Candidatus Rhabdochlamydia sp.]
MKNIAYSLVLLSLTSCYSVKEPLLVCDIPMHFEKQQLLQEEKPLTQKFWESLQDPVLNELEELAITANLDLKIAILRIEEAESMISHFRARKLPQVEATLQGSQNRGVITSSTRGGQENFSLLMGLSYDVDLWGKLKDQEKSAQLKADSVSWERDFIHEKIVCDVAFHYLKLRSLEKEIKLLEKSLQLREEKVELYHLRLNSGVDSKITLARSQLALATAQGELESVKEAYGLHLHSLAALVGKTPSSFTLKERSMPSLLPSLPQVLPSEVIQNRSDIQQQISQIASRHFEVSAALKDYFPTFSLTTALGVMTPQFVDLISWQSRYWSALFSLIQPLFDQTISAKVAKKEVELQMDITRYQKKVIEAFQEVEDALLQFESSRKQLDIYQSATKAAEETAVMTHDQFQAGLISYLLLADAEDDYLATERKKISLEGMHNLSWIKVMKALGVSRES